MEVINLNLIPQGVTPVVHASQFDDGRVFGANLFEGISLYTLTGTETLECDVKKPDGTIVTVNIPNTSGSYIEITMTEQMTACHGVSVGEVRITDAGDNIGSLNFMLAVEESPLNNGIESDSSIHNLETQIREIDEEIVPGLVADEVATQYDSGNVIFDAEPTEDHGIGYAVTSEGLKSYIPKAIDELDDVEINNPQANQAIVYNPTTQKFENGEVSTVGGLNDLNDVTLSDVQDKQELVYDDTDDVFKNKTTRIELTQAEYDALANPLPDVDYYITDAPSMQGTSADLSYDGTTLSTYDKIEEVASDVSDCKVERQYYTGTTSGYGNLALGAEFDSNTKVIISATARNKTNTNTVYIADIYQNDVNRFGTTYGLHVRNITDNSAVANTVIEGYIWLVKFTAT